MFAANKTGVTSTPAATTDPYFNYTTLLLNDTGTNGAQNNTFVDSSTNNFSITRNGNTTQGSFNPYEPTGYWGGYFDGTGDNLTVASNAAFSFGTGDVTIECWINYNLGDSGSYYTIWSRWSSLSDYVRIVLGSSGEGYKLYYTLSGTNYTCAKTKGMLTGSWNHIALVRSSGAWRLYVNGTLENVSTAANPTTYPLSSVSDSTNYGNASFYTGCVEPTTYFQFFPGYISNLRVVKGTAVYTSNFTVPTTPLTAITNTSLLCLQDNRFKDNSSNNFTLTRSGDVAVTGFNPFAPTASYTTSAYGGSAYFDGSGDNLSLPTNTALEMGSGSFTWEFWVYATSYGTSAHLLAQQAVDTTVQFDSTNSNQLIVYDGSTRIIGTIPLNAWTHVAIVRNSTTLQGYINGVASGSSWTNSSSTRFTLSTGYIASRWTGSNAFTGYISNLRVVKGTAVYTAAFTPPTIPLTAISGTSLLINTTNAGIYNATALNDLETAGNAQASTTQSKWGASSMYFDGTGDYLLGPNNNIFSFGTGDFTIEYWLYPVSFSASPTIFDTRLSGTSTVGYSDYYSTSGAFNLYIGNSTVFTSTSTISLNTWTHIAVSRSGTSLRVFINGTQNGSTVTNSINLTDTSCIVATNRGTTAGTIGTSYFNGYLEDLRVTKGIARYTANFTAPTAAFPTR